MAKRKIRIECEGAAMIPYTELEEFQGNLKELTRDNYEALKKQILESGFSEPISVWKDKGKIGNGHQRLRTVKRMVEEEGFQINNAENALPVNYIKAKNDHEFARKVLGLAGSYGKTTKEGLFEYLETWDFNTEEFAEGFRLAGIDNQKFLDEFFPEELDELDLAGEPEVVNPEEDHPENVPTAQVRMVQLFFDSNTAEGFSKKVEFLKEYFGTTNVTDTVLNAVEESFNAHYNSEE